MGEFLAEQDLDLDKCRRIATARETARRSQDTINTPIHAVDRVSAYKPDMKRIIIPRDCCTGFGKKKLMTICDVGTKFSESCVSFYGSPGVCNTTPKKIRLHQ